MLLRDFYATKEQLYGIKFDVGSCVETVNKAILHSICLVGPTSCASASIEAFPFNYDEQVASVQWWYFKRPREIAIFDALKDEAKKHGATIINPASHPPLNSISRFYVKRHIYPVELQHLGLIK
jgi:hypothetical protein